MAVFSDIPEPGRKAHIGHYVSGIAHVGLIGWLLLGPLFEVEPLPFDVTNVTTISAEEYAALVGAQGAEEATPEVAPVVPEAPQAPETPPAEDTPPPIPVEEAPAPEPPAPQEVTPAPLPETVPEQPEPPAPVVTEAQDVPPPEPAPPAQEDVAVVLPERTPRPRPRPAPRVAPEPVAPPEPEVQIEDTTQDAIVPDEAPAETAPQDEQEATAEEEATSEIVTEADEPPSGAPERSVRPRPKPRNIPAPAAPAATETAEAPEPPATPAAPPVADTSDAVNDLLADLQASGATEAPAAPSGPPLTGGEREALREAVQECWRVDVGSAASRVTVVVAMEMEENGRVVTSSLRMVRSDGGDGRAAEIAFQAARRAIIRCQTQGGRNGYDLPAAKYDQWREIEMTFNPENVGRNP